MPETPRPVGLSRGVERWRRAALATASLLLATLVVVAGEWAVRALSPDSLVRSRGLLVASSRYGWALRPGVSLRLDGVRYTTNAQGRRGRETAPARPRERARLVLVGDSVAFGLGVSDEDTFAAILDRRDGGLEVVNLAVQGYGPDQELLLLEREGLAYDPDVVIVALCAANDLADVTLAVSLYNPGAPKPRFRMDGDELVLERSHLDWSSWERLQRFLADESYLLNRLVPSRRSASPDGGWHARFEHAQQQEPAALRLTRAILRRMQLLCRQRGVSFAALIFPDASGFRAPTPAMQQLKEALTSDGIEVIEPMGSLRAQGVRWRHVALDGVGHLSPYGHLLTAELLQERFQDHAPRAPAAP